MTVIVDSPEFAELIDPAATMTEIGSGYQFSEGPVWNVREQALVLQRHPRRRPLALDRGDRDGAASPGRRSRATAWPSTLDGSLLVCEQVIELRVADPS